MSKPLHATYESTAFTLPQSSQEKFNASKWFKHRSGRYDALLDSVKSPQYYIRQASQKFLSRQSSRTHSRASLAAQYHKSPSQKVTGQSSLPPKSIYPPWLTNREQFIEHLRSCSKITPQDVASIVKLKAANRSRLDKEKLFLWVAKVGYFKKLPSKIVREVSKKLTFRKFKAGETIFRGEEGESMFVVLQGSVEIYVNQEKVSELSCGKVFGEIALESESARSGTSVANTSVKLLELSKFHYGAILSQAKLREKQENARFLSKIALFKEWPQLKLLCFCSSLVTKTFAKGELVFDEGDVSNTFYIIKSGKVDILKSIHLTQSNKWPTAHSTWRLTQINKTYRATLQSLTSPAFFGETELLRGSKRACRAVARKKTLCLTINSNRFFELLTQRDLQQLQFLTCLEIPQTPQVKARLLEELHCNQVDQEALKTCMPLTSNKCRLPNLDYTCQQKWVAAFKQRRESSPKSLRNEFVSAQKQSQTVGTC